MSHMLDSHYLFGLSPAILKHRIFSFSVSSPSLQSSVKTFVHSFTALKLFTAKFLREICMF